MPSAGFEGWPPSPGDAPRRVRLGSRELCDTEAVPDVR